MERIPVVRTYLSLPSEVELIASPTPVGGFLLLLRPCPFETAGRPYQGVGADCAWRDRLAWSEAQWKAITAAREWRPTRVSVHRCTPDGPYALPNYLARGFEPDRTEHYAVDAPLG